MNRLHFGILGTTTACLSALLANPIAAQGERARTHTGTAPAQQGRGDDANRFVDAVVLRGVAVYGQSGERTGAGARDKKDENDAQDKGRETAAAAGRGDLLGSVSDLIACHGQGKSASERAGEGCPVKVLVQLASGTASARGTDAAAVSTPTTVAVPLDELTWHDDGRYFTCNKARAVVLGDERRVVTDVADGGKQAAGADAARGTQTATAGECKFSDLTMAPIKTSDGVTGRVASLILDCKVGGLAYVLASGFDAGKAKDAASERGGAGTGDAGAQRKGEAVASASAGRAPIVVPFSVLRIESATAGQATTPSLSVPIAAAALAGAPELPATQLARLADPTLGRKITAFYATARR